MQLSVRQHNLKKDIFTQYMTKKNCEKQCKFSIYHIHMLYKYIQAI